MNFASMFERFKEQYGEDYAKFLQADFGPPPHLCPYCQTETLRKLWLGDTARKLGDSIWAKWYLWCKSCLRGIYCPIGTYAVPRGEPYIQWGDDAALKRSLPSELKLVKPVTPDLF
jgi:hypothetical protein